MYLLIDRIHPEGHTRAVTDLKETYLLEYLAGKIDIVDLSTMQYYTGSLDCPDWAPLLLESSSQPQEG